MVKQHRHTYLLPPQPALPLARCLNTQTPCDERYRMHSNQQSDLTGWGTAAQQSAAVAAGARAKAHREANG